MTEGEDTSAALVLIRSGDLSRPTAVEITTASGSADGNIIIIFARNYCGYLEPLRNWHVYLVSNFLHPQSVSVLYLISS